MADRLELLRALHGRIQDMVAHRNEEEARRADQAAEMAERGRQILEHLEQLERDIEALPPTPENEAELRRLTEFVEEQRRALNGPAAPEPDPAPPQEPAGEWRRYARYAAVGTAAGGAIAATGGVALLGLVGFGSGGIGAGTIAAAVQSVVYGTVPTVVFSWCQSAAATGVIGAVGMAYGAGIGAAAGAAAAKATAA